MPTSALNGENSILLLEEEEPDISYFRVFGCLAYVLIPKHKRKALQPTLRSAFCDYPDGTRLGDLDPVDRKIIISSVR